jgi:hypothetical protein
MSVCTCWHCVGTTCFRPPCDHHQARLWNLQANTLYMLVEVVSIFSICFICRIKLVKIMIKFKINSKFMLYCYSSYLWYDDILLFLFLAGNCCCLVSGMYNIVVLSVLLFNKVLTMGRSKCYVRILFRVGLWWFMDLSCGCLYGGPFYILHACEWGRM